MKKYYSTVERPKKVLEMNDGSTLTETAGYRPPKVQVQELISAGARLMEYRREMYDVGADENVFDDSNIPANTPYRDILDAIDTERQVKARIREQYNKAQEEAKIKKEEDGGNRTSSVDSSGGDSGVQPDKVSGGSET